MVNYTSTSRCELSPSASAFSSMLSAFIGSVLNGLFSGFWIAFFTGWISPFAVFRILAASCYEWYITVKAGTDFTVENDGQYQHVGLRVFKRATEASGAEQSSADKDEEEARLVQSASPVQVETGTHDASSDVKQPPTTKPTGLRAYGPQQPERTVTIFGWLAWVWAAVYTPISQSIWLSVNVPSDKGALQLVRALSLAVCALPLSFDYKQRYAVSVGRRWGSWAFVAFNVWNSTACLLLGLEAAILLIHGAMHADVPIPFFIIYPIFSIIWGLASWGFLPPIDGARPGFHWAVDVFMGAFAGLFLAAPAFALWQSEKFNRDFGWGDTPATGMELGEFLRCEGAGFWQKFAAVMP